MADLVYILTNPTIPDLVKIGQTKNLEERMKQLYSHSGVAAPFECYYCCQVKDGPDVETRLLSAFGDHRINQKREFLRINPERIKDILEALSLKDMTPGVDIVEDSKDQSTLDRARANRPRFRFSMVDIEVGAELSFLKDENVICHVHDDKNVEFEDRVCSLAQELMQEISGKNWKTIRGPDFWVFENETLTERRLRMEESED